MSGFQSGPKCPIFQIILNVGFTKWTLLYLNISDFRKWIEILDFQNGPGYQISKMGVDLNVHFPKILMSDFRNGPKYEIPKMDLNV